MGIFKMHGKKEKAIIATGCCTQGKVIKAEAMWYIKINTKPVRSGPFDGALFPHRIIFTYEVDGQKYAGRKLLPYYEKAPHEGEDIKVFYDPQDPRKCAVEK